MNLEVGSLSCRRLQIDPDRCIGCSRCRQSCPENAILGIRGYQHAILPGCTGCDRCKTRCPTQAIYLAPNAE